MYKSTIWALVFIGSLFFSCAQNSAKESSYSSTESSISAQENLEKADHSSSDLTNKRMLIKKGKISFETDDIKKTHKEIDNIVKKFNGYIGNDNEFSSNERKTNRLHLHIPSLNFDNALDEIIQSVSTLDEKEINVTDVTEEFVDIEARIKTKKELENRYIQLLSKAQKIDEILEIEKEIENVRSEIESAEGRMKYLQNSIAYSFVELSIYQRIPKQTQFGKKFKTGLSNGWNGLIWFFIGLTNIWPFLLILVFLILLYKFTRNRKKK